MSTHIPLPGQTWNPLRDYPRNAPCLCGGGRKFKHCHALSIPITCTLEAAQKLQPIVDMANEGKDVLLAIQRAEEKL